MRRRPRRGYRGKVKHATPEEAAAHAAALGDPHVRPYQCPTCDGWHGR